MDDILGRTTAVPQVTRRRFRVVADGDGADRFVVIRHAERLAERRHGFGHDAEVQRAEPLSGETGSAENWRTMCRRRTTSVKSIARPAFR